MNPIFYSYIILPLIIIIARIMDVSLGTLRIILISKGLKKVAPLIGFFEVFIWIVVVKQILTDIQNPITYFAYAFGYALGTYIGIWIEDKLSLGNVMIRFVIKDHAQVLTETLRSKNYGVTTVDAQGKDGLVKIVFTIINRKDLIQTIKIIENINPNAFYTIEDIQSVNSGFFYMPLTKQSGRDKIRSMFLTTKKSK